MEKNIPKRRFKEFIGSGEWEEKKFSNLANLRRGLTYSPSDIEKKGIIVLRSSNIKKDRFVLNNDDVFVRKKAVNIELIKENDILITSANGSSHLVGKHAIVPKVPIRAVHGGFMLLASAKKPFFTNALMSSNWYTKFIKTYIAGGNGAIGNLSKNNLEKQKVFIPSPQEQEKIGKFFEKLDRLIALNRKKLEKLKNIKSAYLSEMFPKEGELYPKRRFAGFTEPWEEKKLGDVVDVNSGKDYKHLSIGNIPVYGTGGYMLSVNKALSYDDAIGIGRKGTIDKPYILKSPFWTVDTLFYVTLKKNNNLNFIFGLFQKIDWKSMDESSGVPSLSRININNVTIKLASLQEQEKIGNFFKKLDERIILQEEKIEKLENMKKAYLSEMFV